LIEPIDENSSLKAFKGNIHQPGILPGKGEKGY
jgi:hypothetical protein